MADVRRRVAENVAGDFFVDDTCIDCDTCRQLAPQVFGEAPETAYVRSQPQSPTARRTALHALVCCPTGARPVLGPMGSAGRALFFRAIGYRDGDAIRWSS